MTDHYSSVVYSLKYGRLCLKYWMNLSYTIHKCLKADHRDNHVLYTGPNNTVHTNLICIVIAIGVIICMQILIKIPGLIFEGGIYLGEFYLRKYSK